MWLIFRTEDFISSLAWQLSYVPVSLGDSLFSNQNGDIWSSKSKKNQKTKKLMRRTEQKSFICSVIEKTCMYVKYQLVFANPSARKRLFEIRIPEKSSFPHLSCPLLRYKVFCTENISSCPCFVIKTDIHFPKVAIPMLKYYPPRS